MVCAKVSGIKAEFAETPEQSGLTKGLTAVAGDGQARTRQRLAGQQQQAATRYAPSGILPIDPRRGEHSGKLSADAGYYGDHAEARHQSAPAYLSANYGCPAGNPDALEGRRFRNRADCAAQRAEVEARAGGRRRRPQKNGWRPARPLPRGVAS